MEDNGCLRPWDVVGPGLPQGLDNMPKALEKRKKNDMNIPEKIICIYFLGFTPDLLWIAYSNDLASKPARA